MPTFGVVSAGVPQMWRVAVLPLVSGGGVPSFAEFWELVDE
jgi:hypothetical protein